MRTLPIACSMILGLAVAGCAPPQTVSSDSGAGSPNTGTSGTGTASSSTGSMAYPQPRMSGEFQRSSPTGSDTGSMAYPTGVRQGQTVPAVQDSVGSDTGSMAYPTPQPAGRIRRSTMR